MDTYKISVIISRLIGLQFIVVAFVNLTYLISATISEYSALNPATAGFRQLEIQMLWLRFGIHVLASAAFFFLARPIADFVSAGLENDK